MDGVDPGEEEYTRVRHPGSRRRARVGLAGAAGGIAVLAGVLWSTQGRPVAPTAPVAAAPTATPTASARPTPVPGGPVLGAGFSAAPDPAAVQLVTFGGVDSFDETWLWNGTEWRLATPAQSPPGRFGAVAAYDRATRGVLLFGGRLAGGQTVNDTWGWDGRTWRELDSGSGGPPPGEGSLMVWDPDRGTMVLVTRPSPSASSTWTFVGTRWARRPAGDLPPGVVLVGLAVDGRTGQVLGAGCCSEGEGSTSTYAWDGSAWHAIVTGATPRFSVGMASDTVAGHALLLAAPALASGRDMWAWDGANWSLLAAHLPAFPGQVVPDVDGVHLVLLGSLAEAVSGAPQPVHVWSWTGLAWVLLS